MAQEEYKVQLDVFEGPLDLLLYLIRKNEVEIHDIPVGTITTQYMAYLDMMQMLDLNIAGEFLVMAATLMMIKSRMLLPVESRPELEDEDDEEDPRWDLVRQLVEYKKFKDAAIFLEDLEGRRENVFVRDGEGVQLGKPKDMSLHDVSIFDLISAFNEALTRVEEEDITELFADQYTVAQKIDDLVGVLSQSESVSMNQLFGKMTHRSEMICTFLALLELMKSKQIRAQQTGTFGEILLTRNDEWGQATEELKAAGGEWDHE